MPQMRALVIDDDNDVATALQLLLRTYGCDSYCCVDSKDCMARIEQLHPDVVLLDLGMPGMSGFDIASELQHNPDLRPLRLVAVTGYSQDVYREQTEASGFDAHLQKPVNFEALKAIVAKAQRIKAAGRPPECDTRRRAYEMWEAAGRPDSDEERTAFWYAAERQLMEEAAAQDTVGRQF